MFDDCVDEAVKEEEPIPNKYDSVSTIIDSEKSNINIQ